MRLLGDSRPFRFPIPVDAATVSKREITNAIKTELREFNQDNVRGIFLKGFNGIKCIL